MAKVDVVPDAETVVVDADGFSPLDYLVPVLRSDGESCRCGMWQFYSAICDHVYQTFEAKCGQTRNKKNTRTIYCPKTSGRGLISNVQVGAPCPYPLCQNPRNDDEEEEEEAASD
jgi:hypothetical protein